MHGNQTQPVGRLRIARRATALHGMTEPGYCHTRLAAAARRGRLISDMRPAQAFSARSAQLRNSLTHSTALPMATHTSHWPGASGAVPKAS